MDMDVVDLLAAIHAHCARLRTAAGISRCTKHKHFSPGWDSMIRCNNGSNRQSGSVSVSSSHSHCALAREHIATGEYSRAGICAAR